MFLHELIMKNKVLVNEIQVAKEEAMNVNTVDMIKYVELIDVDKEKAITEDMLTRVKSGGRFKRSAMKGRC